MLCAVVAAEDRLADLLLDKAASCSVQLWAGLALSHLRPSVSLTHEIVQVEYLRWCKQPRVCQWERG